jgi:hypothetical protein
MKTTIWVVKAILLLLLFNSCQSPSNPVSILKFKPEPIIKLLMLDRDLYEPITDEDLLNFEEYGLYISDSFLLKDLAIKGYIFNLSRKSCGGPTDQVLCFCWNKNGVQQVEFVSKGEYPFSAMNRQGRSSGKLSALGFQLSNVVYLMGPEISKDKNTVQDFLCATMTILLKCPPLSKKAVDDYFLNMQFMGINSITGERILSQQSIQNCMDQLLQIQTDMADMDADFLYFQGNLYNGIWRAKLEYKISRYVIRLDYLNGECAFSK